MALETILLAVGPNDKERIDELAEIVIDIAGPAGANVVLAHVFTQDQFEDVTERLDFEGAVEEDADEVAGRHSTVRDLGDRFDEADIDYSVRGSVGEHGEQIVSLAERTAADLVVVGGRSRSPAGKAVFGSTAQEVMLNSPAPVTFVRGD